MHDLTPDALAEAVSVMREAKAEAAKLQAQESAGVARVLAAFRALESQATPRRPRADAAR